jgi:hypothetical protein
VTYDVLSTTGISQGDEGSKVELKKFVSDISADGRPFNPEFPVLWDVVPNLPKRIHRLIQMELRKI